MGVLDFANSFVQGGILRKRTQEHPWIFVHFKLSSNVLFLFVPTSFKDHGCPGNFFSDSRPQSVQTCSLKSHMFGYLLKLIRAQYHAKLPNKILRVIKNTINLIV